MPRVSGDRYTSQEMSDCVFCPDDGGRRFRTTRQCAGCSRSLCLSCRPWVPQQPYLCPECGGGPRAAALAEPEQAAARLETDGHPVPYWLEVLAERARATAAEELIAPE